MKLTDRELAIYHKGYERGFNAGMKEGGLAILDQQAEDTAHYRAVTEGWDKPGRKATTPAPATSSIWTKADDEDELAFLRKVFSERLFPERLHPLEPIETIPAEA